MSSNKVRKPESQAPFTVCGLSSVLAVATHTPQLIERLFFDETNAPKFAEACRFLARSRKIYRLVKADELRKITDTTHHQGAAVVMAAPGGLQLGELSLNGNIICLHDVLNPHNVGAIVRTAAFFGFPALVVSRATHKAAMTASAWRVAEGGLTHLKLFAYDDARDFFAWAKEQGAAIAAAVKPEKAKTDELKKIVSRLERKNLIVCLGNEEEGLPQAFTAACDQRFSIQGSGKIESLNVSVTAALCLNEIQAAR